MDKAETSERPMEAPPDDVSEYVELARLPLRRPALAINAPALTWHYGRRMHRIPGDPPSEDPPSDWQDATLSALNTYLLNLQKALGKKKLRLFDTGDARADILVQPRDSLFFIAGTFDCVRLRLCVDMHEEYYTLTLIADGFHECSTGIGARVRAILETLDARDCTLLDDDARKTVRDIYDGFWTDLMAKVKELDLSALPGQQFVNLRGMTGCPPLVGSALSERSPPLMQLPSHDIIDQRRRRVIRDTLMHYVDRRPNFFAAALGMQKYDTENAATDDANAVLCGMLDGAAVFGIGLKPVSNAGTDPLRFFVLYDGVSSMQLGRLVRRLHVLAELRMMALTEMETFRKASRTLRAAGYQDGLGPLRGDYVKVTALLAGGLSYRINQSRYYAQIYREGLQDLRIVRIEGWQPYDEFVRRTIFRDFDFIDQVGKRYETLADRIRTLTQDRTLAELKFGQDVGNEIQFDLSKVQHIAEFFGAAAFTYYGAHVLDALAADAAPFLPHDWQWMATWLYPVRSAGQPEVAATAYLVAMAIYFVFRIVFGWRLRRLKRAA